MEKNGNRPKPMAPRAGMKGKRGQKEAVRYGKGGKLCKCK